MLKNTVAKKFQKRPASAVRKGSSIRRSYLGLAGVLVFLAACNSGLEPQVPETTLTTQAGSCLNQSGGKLIKLSGTYRNTVVVRQQSSPRIDARNARMTDRPSFVGNNNRNSLCLSGGTYDVGLSLSASWSAYHGSTSLIFFNTPNITVEGVAVTNSGDGASFKDGTNNWLLRDSYIKHAGDDGVENDRYSNGTVRNVLIDNAFMGFSCRKEKTASTSPRNHSFNIENSLLALDSRRSAYLFKVDEGGGSRCKLNLKNNVFLLPKDAGFVDPQDSPRVSSDPLNEGACSGNRNTIVYTGGNKSYLAYLKNASPTCFTVTTDKNVWTKARSAWFSRHSEFSRYR